MRARPLRSAESSADARFSALMAEASAGVVDFDLEQTIAALGELERVRARLWSRIAVPPAPSSGDRLLSAKAAAAILDVPEKAMYRESWPFAVKLSEGRVRFSERGIQQYLRARQGRA